MAVSYLHLMKIRRRRPAVAASSPVSPVPLLRRSAGAPRPQPKPEDGIDIARDAEGIPGQDGSGPAPQPGDEEFMRAADDGGAYEEQEREDAQRLTDASDAAQGGDADGDAGGDAGGGGGDWGGGAGGGGDWGGAPPSPVLQPQVTALALSPLSPTVSGSESVQFRAVATMSDGTQQDATSTVTWSPNAPDGLFTKAPTAKGTATVSAIGPPGTTTSTTVTLSDIVEPERNMVDYARTAALAEQALQAADDAEIATQEAEEAWTDDQAILDAEMNQSVTGYQMLGAMISAPPERMVPRGGSNAERSTAAAARALSVGQKAIDAGNAANKAGKKAEGSRALAAGNAAIATGKKVNAAVAAAMARKQAREAARVRVPQVKAPEPMRSTLPVSEPEQPMRSTLPMSEPEPEPMRSTLPVQTALPTRTTLPPAPLAEPMRTALPTRTALPVLTAPAPDLTRTALPVMTAPTRTVSTALAPPPAPSQIATRSTILQPEPEKPSVMVQAPTTQTTTTQTTVQPPSTTTLLTTRRF